jgi:hypothetical protein
MRVSIGEFSAIDLRGVDFGELDLSLGCDSHQFDSPPEGELLQPGCEAIVDDDCVGVEGGPCDPCVELAPALLHGADDVDDRSHLAVLELVQHLPDGQVLLVGVGHLDQLGQLAAREQEVVGLPQLLLAPRHAHQRVLQLLLHPLLLLAGRTGQLLL